MKQERTPEGVVAEMQIAGAEASDAGAYFCRASNDFGDDQQLVQLQVQALAGGGVGGGGGGAAGSGAGAWQQLKVDGPPAPRQALVEELKPATAYVFRVAAAGPAGRSRPSAELMVRTEPQRPAGAPLSVAARALSSTELLVTWAPPRADLRHGDLQGYNVGFRDASQDTMYEAKGLRQHVKYQFWVTAFTRVGEGQSSPVVSQVPSSRVPPRIASFGATLVRPQLGHVTLACHSVGQPTPRREWFKNGQPLPSSAAEMALARLQPSDAANYTCRVDNGQGSDLIVYHLTVQVPPSPPDLHVRGTTSNSVLLYWTPGATGGTPLAGYTLHYRRAHGDAQELALPRRATRHELKGLLCGSTYAVHLVARNKVGASRPSQQLSVRTQGQAPGVPAKGALLQPNSSSVLLRLHAWPDNGCPLTYFVVQYRPEGAQQWTLVSNSLKPQRRFTISGLTPSSMYRLKIEAHNIAGSSKETYSFVTLTKDGDPPPLELVKGGTVSTPFYTDVRIMVPLVIAVIALFGTAIAVGICWRNKHSRPLKESLDNQQNAEAQRERYYATIHKVAVQAAGDKIPETSEDISPYATFQLSGPGVDPNNTLLHSFMYHEQAMTEGCASPPPSGVPKGGARRRGSRKTEVETDDSDSDPDQLTSSRTESSNQLDTNKFKHNFIYHGAQSSTSSDISPMSEQKSLPRRGRASDAHLSVDLQSSCRWLVPSRPSLRTLLPPLTVAEATFSSRPPPQSESGDTPDRPELSEAECDIDTLKKLKLGLRSSLWSRPSSHHHNQSDYSIAV
ncbi:Down syndrome cell adhesion molecule-like protein Dscam2 [Gryllus bimaculatus]|nr:Down syndrome cell adhesion molecule-like protein Dscam2 [Gryllus bimaculatus]